jgi:hypothetical protein
MEDARQVKSKKEKSRACSSFSLTSKGFFTKNSSWQTEQSIQHTTVTLYGNCEKICPEFFRKKLAVASQQRTISHYFFSPENIWPKQLDCRPHLSYFPVFSIEDKTERHN